MENGLIKTRVIPEIGFWRELIDGELAIEILRLCIEKMHNQEATDWDRLTPVGRCKTFLDTLQYQKKDEKTVWFIQYNVPSGSSRIASIDFDTSGRGEK